MKRKSIIYSAVAIIIILVAVIFIRSCNRKTGYIDPAFSEYISAFTSGRISVSSNIRIELTNEISSAELNLPVKERLFSFSPSIDGEAYWIDNRTIEFRPAKPMKQGTTYQVKFLLGKIMEVPGKFKTFIYSFETITQEASVEVSGYQPYIFTSLDWNTVEGKLLTADFADDMAIEEMVTATQEGKKLSIKWVHMSDSKEHKFVIDSVYRSEKASEVIISWDGKKIGAKTSGEEKVKIPSIYDFFVLDAKVEQEPEQYIAIRFSDPLNPKQNLEGLIHSETIAGFTFEINGMEIKAYPTTRQTGTANINVEQGILNIAGAKLKESHLFELVFESIKPAVRFAGKGVILPDSKGLIVPFEAVNVKAVDLRIIKIYENNIGQFLQINQLDGAGELRRAGRLILKKTLRLGSEKPIIFNKWNSFSIDLSQLIKQEPGAIYRVQLSFKQSYSTYPCGSDKVEDESDDMTSFQDRDRDDFERESEQWDNPVNYYYEGDYEYYEGEYNWEERENPCSASYFYGSERSVSKNVFASNIGIIAKGNSANFLTVAVSDLITAKPLSGAEIEVYNYQKQLIGKGNADNDGFCSINAKGKPFFILAKNGEQRGYLRVDDGSSLSLSNFDVSGEVIQKGLKGFIYGERGVWRPGDTVYLTFILEDKLSNIPDNHPVILEVINPLGKKVKRISKTNGENGFYTFIFSTLESDVTGNYQANIKIGANLFTKTLKIETIKPNRLKINFNFGSDILSESNQDATLNVKWLHGAPAKNMKAKVDVTLSSTTTSFKGFEGYVFNDPTKSFSTDEQTVFDGSIDDKGDAAIHSELSVGNSAPGMLRANFVTRVFEPGGDFSIDRINVLYSPYSVYVGVKCPEGEYRYVDTDTAQTFEIATVNSEGKPVNTENLEFKIYKLEWRWWWGSDNNDLANFTSSNYQSTVFSTHVNTVNGKGKVSFRLNYPNWGRYLVTVTDHTNGHSTGNIVYFDWPLWRGRADREDSKGVTMLTFNSDKHTYEVGNKATITVPTPANSRMLVSLETGSEILKAWWVNSDPKETRFSFDITENMTPNVYVNVSLIQPHTQVENDMPMRMYGVIPLLVENPGAKLMPLISMPDVLLPEQKATIKIKEKNNKPMTYTLAIVDDGLLDLTRFKTPDPYTAFNGKEALGIKTWDLYDLVMGAYGGKIEQLFSIGGDDALSGKDGAKAQRFKPVVKFLGPFTLKSGSNSHVVQLPAYIGSVRVMVIAGSKGTFGSAEKTVPVRKPLMVLATLPRVLGPGEEVDLPVTVFAMEKSVKKVSVEVVPNEYFTAIEGKSKSMEITELGEYTIPFRLKVNAKIGVGKVKVIASSGYEKAEYAIEIQIRNPNPRIVKYTESNCNASSGTNIGYELIGIACTNKATLEVSSIPPIDLSRKIEYLLTYPYGCAEQTTSGAFPQIYVNKFIELSEYDKKRRDEHINYTIRYINSLMNSEGGIMYWPGNGSANDWVTSYTGHFMLEAEKAGYNLPSGFINNWLKYQKKNARSWTIDYNHYYQNDLVQAYRLFTLALAKEPEVGAMNRMKELKNLSVSAAWRLAAAYVLIGQKDEALKLIQTVGKEIKEVERFNYTFGSAERDWAMMLETLCLLNDKTAAFPLAKKISAVLSGNNWVSTQTTAYCLLSMSRFLEIADVSSEIKFSYQLAGKSAIQVSTRLPVAKVSLPVDKEGTQTITLHNFTKGTLFMRVITEGIPETGPETGYENSLKMTIIYKNSSGGTVDVSRLSQGTDFAAEVTVKSLYPSVTITNLALSHVFPSGWEISNTRFLNENSEQQGYSNFTYQDFRDDRVNTFFDLPVNGYKTFTVKLTATYSGKFYLPGTLCEAMYEPGINAFMPGRWVEVVK